MTKLSLIVVEIVIKTYILIWENWCVHHNNYNVSDDQKRNIRYLMACNYIHHDTWFRGMSLYTSLHSARCMQWHFLLTYRNFAWICEERCLIDIVYIQFMHFDFDTIRLNKWCSSLLLLFFLTKVFHSFNFFCCCFLKSLFRLPQDRWIICWINSWGW